MRGIRQARGQIHRLAGQRESLPGAAAATDDHLAGGDADMRPELPSGGLAYGRHGDLVDRERGADRPLAVVAMRHGRAEDRHDAVAGVLIHRAPVVLDLAVDGPEEAEHQLVQLFGVELAGEPGVARQIGEQHGHLPPLALAQRRRADTGHVPGLAGVPPELCDRGEQLLAVADRDDAELPQIPCGERRQDRGIDVIAGKRLGVFAKTERTQPPCNVCHRPAPEQK